jgi:hypothetical protein
VHVAAESEAAFPSATAERIENMVKYTKTEKSGVSRKSV